MKEYLVRGSCVVDCSIVVEAEDGDEALDIADSKFNMLTEYCGNGGTDKLVGTELDEVSLSASNPIYWDEVEEY